jgi:hypothetical protein
MTERSENVVLTTDSNDVPFPSWEAWNRIRNGALMPCLESDRGEYDAQKQFAASRVKHTSCVECKQRFSDGNCFTQAGWEETQISGLCESCFDEMTAEPEDEGDDGWDGEGLEGDDELSNCHAFVDGGVFVCGAAGSEDCDECSFNCELGTRAEYEPEETFDD